MNVTKRLDAAHRDLAEAERLIELAARTVYGVPEMLRVRAELALARLELLKRSGNVRVAGPIDFESAPAPWELSVRTQKRRPDRAGAGGRG